jgi:serine/threonine-protein kinase
MAAPVDGRSDLFSSGAVLHELLAGARAFPGSSMIEVVRRVVDGTQTPLPDTIREGFPALAAVVDRALAKKAEDRFGSAEQMAQALRASLAPPAQGPALPDATVIQAPAHVREPMLDDATIGTLERNLAAYIGPIAGVMLRSALRQAGSREELVETVAAAIQSAPDRARFLAEATRSLAGAAPGPGSSRATATPVAAGPDAAALEAAKKALLPHIGPLASALVRRAAADGAGIDVVWQRLAQHIEQEKERAVFLAKKPG